MVGPTSSALARPGGIKFSDRMRLFEVLSGKGVGTFTSNVCIVSHYA